MADRPERLSHRTRLSRTVLVAGAGALVMFLAGGWLIRSRHAPTPAMRSLVVEPRPFSTSVDLAGTVAPGQAIDVVAPFDGAVSEINFVYGDPVNAGQVLLHLDSAELAQHDLEAQTAVLKAQQDAQDIDHWETSPDVSRARRAKEAADAALADAQRKLKETKALLDRGLVARTEYDSDAQQVRTQEMNDRAAAEDLASAMARGKGPNRQIAHLALDIARGRLADFARQRAQAIVKAPSSGILIRPSSGKAEDNGLHVGQRLTRGQLIGSVARPDALSVDLFVNEADAARIKVGADAAVTGAGLPQPLAGRVLSVAGEAHPSEGGGAASVLVRIQLPPAPAGAPPLRIGSTVNVSIRVYDAPRALVVPPEAVTGGPPVAQVLVRPSRTAKPQTRAVTLGEANPDGVEILAGLRPGETVVWPGR